MEKNIHKKQRLGGTLDIWQYWLRDAIIKENPVKSGFLQIGGTGGLRGHPIQIFYMWFKISDFMGRGGSYRLLKLAVQIYFWQM